MKGMILLALLLACGALPNAVHGSPFEELVRK
jgi:hypothetical protein